MITTNIMQAQETISLMKPNLDGGASIMQSLAKRSSIRDFDTTPLTIGDLSNLLWAANGINREDGKRTAPSAYNAQDIEIFVFLKEGVYYYDAADHKLVRKAKGDHRKLIAAAQEFVLESPTALLLVSDLAKLERSGDRKELIASIDAGIVSQNIALFCAGNNLANIPRIGMKTEEIKELLDLGDSMLPVMNNVVGYFPK